MPGAPCSASRGFRREPATCRSARSTARLCRRCGTRSGRMHRDYVCAPPSQSNAYKVNKMAAATIKPKKIAGNHDPSSSRDAGPSLLSVIGMPFAGRYSGRAACHRSGTETRRRGCRSAESTSIRHICQSRAPDPRTYDVPTVHAIASAGGLGVGARSEGFEPPTF